MNSHSGGQPCVMHLNAADGMGHNETPPFVVDGFVIRQEDHALFYRADFPVRVRRRQAETVPVRRPRSYLPELGYILVRVVQNGPASDSLARATIHNGVVRVIAPRDSEKDIGVDQVSWELGMILIDHFAGERFAGPGRNPVCFLLHWKPLLGNFQIQPGIGQRSCFQPFSQIGRAFGLDQAQHRPIDEPAAVAPRHHAVQHGDGDIGQDNVDAFAHRGVTG